MLASPAAAQSFPDSTTAAAGAHYAARGPLGFVASGLFGAHHRRLWAARFDALDRVVEELKRKEKAGGRKQRK